MIDYRDFYIEYPGHPRYTSSKLIEDDLIRVIVQKYEMIIFTNKGDVLGEPDFGADLEKLLHETKVSSKYVEKDIIDQIMKYIPEIFSIDFKLNVVFTQDPQRHQDIMFINFQISDYEVFAYVK